MALPPGTISRPGEGGLGPSRRSRDIQVSTSGLSHESGHDQYMHLVPLHYRYAELAPNDPQRLPLRDQLVRGYLPLAKRLAHRFARRGEPSDDLIQIAAVGLVHAVDRFEPHRGTHFLAYAEGYSRALTRISAKLVARRCDGSRGRAVHGPRRDPPGADSRPAQAGRYRASTLAMLPASALGSWMVGHMVRARVPQVMTGVLMGSAALACFGLVFALLTGKLPTLIARVQSRLTG